jgi:hypothetical protein
MPLTTSLIRFECPAKNGRPLGYHPITLSSENRIFNLGCLVDFDEDILFCYHRLVKNFRQCVLANGLAFAPPNTLVTTFLHWAYGD